MSNFDAIPQELKLYPQWVVWRWETLPNGKKTKVPFNPVTGWKASVTNSSHWGTVFDAQRFLTENPHWNGGAGFVLTERDPFTFIDLDDANATNPDGSAKFTPEQRVWIADAQRKVYEAYSATYAELSPSGTGLHLIGRGSVPCGVRGMAIEMYSSGRYMTMTGNVHRAAEITDTAAQNEWLWNLLGGAEQAAIEVDFENAVPESESDDVIIAKALNASNGGLVERLLYGNWAQDYTSQSEADFALIDILAFYTHAPQQIERIFLASQLGQRDKAKRKNYVLPMIKRAFDRLPPPIDMASMRRAMDNALKQAEQRGQLNGPARIEIREQQQEAAALLAPKNKNPYLQPLPGMLHEIAYYIYQISPRPVPEIALASAIGLMAGICGRGWNVSRTGLNQYIMLLAGTGRGKETVHDGISRLIGAVADLTAEGGHVPAARQFIGPGDIASGQALVKYLSTTSKSFVTVQGEFDVTLKSFTDKHANSALLKLRQILLAGYSRSGKGMVLPPTIYSDKDKNTEPISAPAFSLLGEGTPERFFNLLDQSMVNDGLLPRFTVIYYEGDRKSLNKNTDVKPPYELVRRLSALCSQSLMLNQANNVIDVQAAPAAGQLLDAFGAHIDGVINAAKNDTIEQIWNRAHLKALKLAALVAVGISPTNPIIDEVAAQWAIDLVTYDTRRLVHKFLSGDIGDSETRQQNDIRKLIKRYFQQNPADVVKWGATPAMQQARVIPKRMLQQRLANVGSFKNDRLGATIALNRALLSLTEAGVIQRLGPQETEKYAVRSSLLFAINDPGWLTEADDD